MTGRRGWAGLAVAAMVLLLGAALVRCTGVDEASGPRRIDKKVVARDRHPSGKSTDRTAKAAVRAAVGYSAAPQRWLYLTDRQIRADVARLATTRFADDLSDEAVDTISEARYGLAASSGRIWWIVRPMATKLGPHDQSRATVSVWLVSVLSASEVAVPQTEWMTLDLDLEWERGAWRVAYERSTAGPTPTAGPGDDPWDAEKFDGALTGFDRVDGGSAL